MVSSQTQDKTLPKKKKSHHNKSEQSYVSETCILMSQ